MEQNENQYEEPDRTKAAFLIGGLLVILAAVILVIYLFTDRTRASTGEGEAVRITPERIEQISDEVSEQVLDTLRTDILAGRIQDAVQKELSSEKLYEILADGKIEAVAVGKEELRDIIAVILADLGISGDGVFTEEQKKYIRLAVKEALDKALTQISVSQLLTDEEKRELEERLKQELSGMLKSQIQNSAYGLTGAELEKLKQSLHIESLVTGAVDKATRQQLEKIKTNLITEIKSSVKTPVKGKDYFTDADIKSIQEKVLKTANKETLKQAESLALKINEVKTSVTALSKLVKELQALDQQKSADIQKLKDSITKINQSIQNIHTVTKQLTAAITITGSKLEQVTVLGSDVQSAPISTADMTIAQFVDVLAGNGQAYTKAIQELNKIVKQLKDDNARQDENFKQTVKELEHSLSDNGKNLENIKAELEKSGKELKAELQKNGEELKKQLDGQSENLEKRLEEEKKEREAADEKLQEQADAADKLTGDPKDAGDAPGDTVFQKIGAIVRILSKDGISGLFEALKGIGGAETVQEGLENLHTDVVDARERVGELEKEKWFSDLVLLAEPEGANGYTYQESGSAYVYQIPLVTEKDQIDLSADDTAVVVHFTKPDRLPSNVALSTSGNALLISFTNRPTRNIHITSIHVYKEK
ncbi:MAG: hypothetical protein K2N87_06980 [Eubacterium sp.]|nr:hypothetical protein [Eubacterium sp.]